MSEAFIPQNNLERHLVAAQEGEVPPESFIKVLMGSEVFMPAQIAAMPRPN